MLIRELFGTSQLIMFCSTASKSLHFNSLQLMYTLFVCDGFSNTNTVIDRWPSDVCVQVAGSRAGRLKSKDPCHAAIVTLDRDVTAQEHCSVRPEVGTPLFNQKCGPHNLLLRFKGFEAHRKPCEMKESVALRRWRTWLRKNEGNAVICTFVSVPGMYKDAPDGGKVRWMWGHSETLSLLPPTLLFAALQSFTCTGSTFFSADISAQKGVLPSYSHVFIPSQLCCYFSISYLPLARSLHLPLSVAYKLECRLHQHLLMVSFCMNGVLYTHFFFYCIQAFCVL